MEQFFSDEDLMDLLEQLDEVEMTALPEEPDEEMEASNRRYMEIIKNIRTTRKLQLMVRAGIPFIGWGFCFA